MSEFIPGRGRRDRGTSHLDVRLDILCPKAHKVGMAWRNLDDDALHVSRGLWTDTPSGGKVEWTCPRCAATVRAKWARIVDALDAAQDAGRHASTFTP